MSIVNQQTVGRYASAKHCAAMNPYATGESILQLSLLSCSHAMQVSMGEYCRVVRMCNRAWSFHSNIIKDNDRLQDEMTNANAERDAAVKDAQLHKALCEKAVQEADQQRSLRNTAEVRDLAL
jgi:hypothetical protein